MSNTIFELDTIIRHLKTIYPTLTIRTDLYPFDGCVFGFNNQELEISRNYIFSTNPLEIGYVVEKFCKCGKKQAQHEMKKIEAQKQPLYKVLNEI